MSSAASVSYDTLLGAGWVAFVGERILATGLPRSENPYREAPPSRAAAELARMLSAYWRGGPLPGVPDEIMHRACRTTLDEAIYRTVTAIPAGQTMTYASVANRVGRPRAARAVGAAMAANSFAPLIPCHRVVGSDGSLRGYAGGIDMKRHLLEMEADG
ncbi:MAG: MGMT family protein [Acidimicrobiia bacterium]|nr:MGMT family protein [Acidimicrobiia bacterium]